MGICSTSSRMDETSTITRINEYESSIKYLDNLWLLLRCIAQDRQSRLSINETGGQYKGGAKVSSSIKIVNLGKPDKPDHCDDEIEEEEGNSIGRGKREEIIVVEETVRFQRKHRAPAE